MPNQLSRRHQLRQLTSAQAEHAGLWFERMLPAIPLRDPERSNGEREERPPQATHIAQTAAIPLPDPLYTRVFARWRAELEERGKRLRAAGGEPPCTLELREATVVGRMAVGLGADGVLETAISLQRSYGVPVIPGSALKGTAAAYAHRYLDESWRKGKPAHIDLFGDTSQAGLVTFYDALYIPCLGRRPLEPDTITVHHPNYYQKSGDALKPPADWDSPTPIPFLSATGSYLVALEGPSNWVEAAFKILELALDEIGVGAKTSSGYGRLRFGAVPCDTSPATSSARRATPPSPTTQPTQPSAPPQKPAGLSLPEIGDVVSGSLAGFLDARKREVKVRLNRVPPYVIGVIPAKLVSGRTSGGLRARVIEQVRERGTVYLYLEPVKA